MALDIASFVLEKLANPTLQEVSLLYGVAGKVASVKKKMEWIKVFLEAAEKKEKEDEGVKLWVDQVREVSFRIEDAIDIYLLEIKGDHTHPPTHKGCRSFSFIRWFYKILKKPVALHNLGVELNDIEATLKEIDENRQSFSINNNPDESKGREESPSIKRCYEFREYPIVGLENEKEDIVEMLLHPQAQNLHVISIVGPGGLGKTTLARKVFDSTEVTENFGERIWISVSQNFDKISILKKMLEHFRKIKEEEKEGKDVHYFTNEIRGCLKRKKVLIVLDDIWDERLWPDIRMVCPDDLVRGRVLITTRNLNVANKAQSELYELKFLNEDESKTLLCKVAFPNKQELPKGLDSAATVIVKKCRGLPLAITAVGGRLYMKEMNSEWRKVADSIHWGSNQQCMQILEASYEDMPSILKTCFIYLAAFPEDHKIDAESLIRTWVAEGLASDEETAQNYLEELSARCLVIVPKKKNPSRTEKIRVHDVLLELAINKAKETKFLTVFANKIPDETSFNNSRRASFQSCPFDERSDNLENERKVKREYNKKLRSLLVFPSIHSLHAYECFTNNLSGFRLLKVLKLHHFYIEFCTLEKWCELIHLRHLELRDCVVEKYEIPESIGQLENLLTLDCTCTIIEKLPESLWSIKTLRHVLLESDQVITRIPVPISADVPNLRTLGPVRLMEPAAPSSSPNQRHYHFPNLRKLLLCQRSFDPWVITLLETLKQLVSLQLANTTLTDLPLDVLDMRAFPWYLSLQSLELTGGWPEHLELRAHLFPPNLIHLTFLLGNIKNDPMPGLGQLQYLEILILLFYGQSELTVKQLTCLAGGFPQLRILNIHEFEGEKLTITPGAMPMLEKLELFEFKKMKKIPELQHLTRLQVFHWSNAPYTYREIQAMKKKDKAKIQHITSVIITSMH